MTPERWRFREPTLFVEAHNRASLAGHAVEWPSVYCIDLVGDQVIRGRRYYDRAPLVAKVLPGGAPPRAVVEPPAIDASFASPDSSPRCAPIAPRRSGFRACASRSRRGRATRSSRSWSGARAARSMVARCASGSRIASISRRAA